MSDKPSLVEFAAKRSQRRVCRVCDCPEVAEINKALRSGISRPTVHAWLVEVRGYEPEWISVHRLERHIRENHDV